MGERVAPGTLLRIRVAGTPTEQPIDALYVVEPSGEVSLGPTYGRVRVEGMTVEEAEVAIETHLKKTLVDPKAMVAIVDEPIRLKRVLFPQAPYRISPGDVLEIRVTNTLLNQPIDGIFLVESGGKVALGPAYGRVELNRRTLEEAEAAIEKHLRRILEAPEVSVTLGGWKNGIDVSQAKPHDRSIELLWYLNQSASQLPVSDSVGVLKKIMETRQAEYNRALEAAGAISVTELHKRKYEFEISELRLRQGERVLRSRELAVQFAEAEYQGALEANKKLPGAVPEAELRRLTLLLELARASVDEMANK